MSTEVGETEVQAISPSIPEEVGVRDGSARSASAGLSWWDCLLLVASLVLIALGLIFGLAGGS